MQHHAGTGLLFCTFAALGLSSCAVKDGQLDFTWWQDAAAPVMEDDVILESGGGGYYRSTPAPAKVPLASIPKEETTPPADTRQESVAVAQQQPAVQPPPATRKNKSRLATSTPGVHVVQPGDTLSALARRYNTSVKALVAANGMADANVPLRVNQQLKLPTAGAATPAASAAPALAAKPAAKPAASAAATTPGTHTVKAGDTIYRISRQYGISPTALMQANGLTPETANTIRVGATLRIPANH